MIEGSFIVIEGIDGAGTTTQTRRLCAWFAARGLAALATHEPSAGPVGSLIRQVLTHRVVVPGAHGGRPPGWRTMAMLFAADRLDHLEAEILPNLMDGVTVVSDRYDLSSLAYQAATAEDPSVIPWLRELNRHARRPDLTIVLDVPASVAGARVRKRAARQELYEDDALQSRLVDAYRGAESLIPGDLLVHIDGSRAEETIAGDIVRAVKRLRGEA